MFVVVEAIIVYFIVGSMIRRAWSAIASPFPEQSIGINAFRKNFQTIAIGSINLGFSVHLVADDNYLHWIPTRLLKIFGCRTMSIPWSSIHLAPKQPIFQKRIAKICLSTTKAQVIAIPRWCLEIKNSVEPDSTT